MSRRPLFDPSAPTSLTLRGWLLAVPLALLAACVLAELALVGGPF